MADYRRFPHLDGSTAFPDVSTVDVYRYANTFDYTRWPENVELTLCCVPWCGDYENVVKFTDDAVRDAWFDSLEDTERIVLDTMRHIVPEQSIKLPIPIGAIQRFNYLMVRMPRFTSDAEPVEHAGGAWKERYFYFIDSAVERAGNTTDCVLRCDFWTTYINDLAFEYVMLARGHAPVARTDVGDYLSDPAAHSAHLLAPDVNFGGAPMVRESSATVLNGNRGNLLFCIVTSASINLNWGTVSEPRIPAPTMCQVQGVPGPHCYACAVDDADALISGIASNMPQFVMTVKCAFMIDGSLVEKVASATVQDVTVWALASVQTVRGLIDLSADSFGYPEEAARYAKLYTGPYAHIEVTDLSGGGTREIAIETLSAPALSMRTVANLVFPWISIDCSIMGAGGDTLTGSFANLSESRYTWTSQGRIGDTTLRLDVPLYSISQPASTYADYTSDYDRAQAKLAADNALASALASNATANTNAVNSANTARTNASNSASNVLANNSVTVAANSNKTSTSNSAAFEGVGYANDHQDSGLAFDINSMSASYLAERDGLAVASTNNDMRASASVIGGIASTVGSIASGDIGGAISGISSIAGSGVSWATTNASIAVSQSNAQTIYQASVAAAQGKTTSSQSASSNATAVQTTAASSLTAIDNNASTSIASNNASLINTNAQNTRDTAVGNANRTKSTNDANADRAHDTAISAIQARLDQAGVATPLEFGERANGVTCTTRPLGIAVQLVTQPDGAIMQAASQFARYGYALNQQWRMTEMQVMKHFTYWECTEVWCAGTGSAVEVAQQAIKDIMERGVTVWSVPEEIGKVSVYDN